MRLVLFDVDGTLLLTHGAGMRALAKAALTHDILEGAFQAVRPDGKTDPQIVRELLRYCGRDQECTPDLLSRFFEDYLSCLRNEMANCRDLRVLPGVRELLVRLSSDPSFRLGLATGNIEEGAWLKLRYAALDSYFRFGGFGSDEEDRTLLIRKAIERGAAGTGSAPPHSAFVIGDTPRDIDHGRAAGATTIAVATGSYSLEELQSHAPDLAVPKLEPIEPVLEFLSK
jgi:phosphoglycolate phosphatase